MSERDLKSDGQGPAQRDVDSAGVAPGRYANTELVGKGRQGPRPKVPGKRSGTEHLAEAEGAEAQAESPATGFAPRAAQANHTLEYGAGDAAPQTARGTGHQPPRTGGTAAAARENFELQNWTAHRNTTLTSDFTNGGESFLVQQGGIAASADVRALTPDAQRYSVGFVQTMHASNRRAIYVDDNGVVRNAFVASRGAVMDQRTDIGSPAPWYNFGVLLSTDRRHPAMSDNPTFEVPAAAPGDTAFVDRLEGSESFTTYVVAMVGNDSSTIIYHGNLRWDVNWSGRIDGT